MQCPARYSNATVRGHRCLPVVLLVVCCACRAVVGLSLLSLLLRVPICIAYCRLAVRILNWRSCRPVRGGVLGATAAIAGAAVGLMQALPLTAGGALLHGCEQTCT